MYQSSPTAAAAAEVPVLAGALRPLPEARSRDGQFRLSPFPRKRRRSCGFFLQSVGSGGRIGEDEVAYIGCELDQQALAKGLAEIGLTPAISVKFLGCDQEHKRAIWTEFWRSGSFPFSVRGMGMHCV